MTSRRRLPQLLSLALLLLGGAWLHGGDAPGDGVEVTPEAELRAVETAFAKTMADRDHDAFAGFLADDVVFFNGDTPTRGKKAVAQAWAPFFGGEKAPFSWKPAVVAVLESGTLGLTSGPIHDPQGKEVGTFNSVWRKGADGEWSIVFDRGCECP